MSITDNHKTLLQQVLATHRQGLILLLLLMCMPAAASAWRDTDPKEQANAFYEYVMKINRSAMAVVDSNVVVSLQMTAIQDVPAMQSVVLAPVLIDTITRRQVDFPLIFINSRNQQIYFERYLKEEYPDAMALRKKRGVNLDIDYLRTVKYEPWMDSAVLILRKQSCACSNPKDRGEMVVASFEQKEVELEINLFPVYLLPPADNSVKVREERGSAYLCFEVNKWDIKPDYMTNPAELQKIHNSVNLVRNDSDVTIRKMTIEGYASPEGPTDHNLMLSEKRTEALKNYLQMTNIAKGIRIEASGKGENWSGMMKYLRDHTDIPQRSKLLNIANGKLSADEKEKQMRREAAEGFAYMVKNGFPSLRCTNYTVIYTVRPFTLEESERVFETRPINLNLNEIYRLADKYAADKEKYYSIIRKAYMLYPNDSYINLTMACLALKKGEADEAAEYLEKVNDCPEKTMNLGLVAYLKGDIDKAVQLVEQARKQGLKEAATQLEEFEKITKK
ncbi:MAG: OmpA family protein [Prevotella sp.]|nr:OmpA family protein [Bacteroidaceae bacterium]MBR1416086.1 OmpA family protein [Prevotella sp.]